MINNNFILGTLISHLSQILTEEISIIIFYNFPLVTFMFFEIQISRNVRKFVQESAERIGELRTNFVRCYY